MRPLTWISGISPTIKSGSRNLLLLLLFTEDQFFESKNYSTIYVNFYFFLSERCNLI